jgi:hypothetical protein
MREPDESRSAHLILDDPFNIKAAKKKTNGLLQN